MSYRAMKLITAIIMSPGAEFAAIQCYEPLAAFQFALTRRNNLRSLGHSTEYLPISTLIASPFAVVVVVVPPPQPSPLPPPPASVISFSS